MADAARSPLFDGKPIVPGPTGMTDWQSPIDGDTMNTKTLLTYAAIAAAAYWLGKKLGWF